MGDVRLVVVVVGRVVVVVGRVVVVVGRVVVVVGLVVVVVGLVLAMKLFVMVAVQVTVLAPVFPEPLHWSMVAGSPVS